MTRKKVNNQFNVGLDLDGVIIDHTKNKIKAAKLLGFDIKEKESSSEILENILPKRKYQRLQKMIYGKLTQKAKPVPFSLKIIQKLSRKSFSLYIISCRKNSSIPLAWLKKYGVFRNISFENIFFVKEEKEKNKIAQKLKIEIFLDDKKKVLDSLSSVPYPILFNPYRIPGKKFLEIKSWEEFPELLRRIKKRAKKGA